MNPPQCDSTLKYFLQNTLTIVAAGFIPISAKLFDQGSHGAIMPYGLVLKDEHFFSFFRIWMTLRFHKLPACR